MLSTCASIVASGKAAQLSIRVEFKYPVAFCVWVLTVDGLQVPPFDRHVDGDGTLRNLGMDADTWKTWLASVCANAEARIDKQSQSHQASGQRFQTLEKQAPLAPPLQRLKLIFGTLRNEWSVNKREGRELENLFPYDPSKLWRGDQAVRNRLSELWQAYEERKLLARQGFDMGMFTASEEFMALQRQLVSEPGPRTFVFLVNYPAPTLYPVSPTKILLGTRGLETTIAAVQDAIRQAVSVAETSGG